MCIFLFTEQYDSYCERARLYTEIHAKSAKCHAVESRKRCDVTGSSESGSGTAEPDKKLEKKGGKLMTKDKKRTLKRL